MSAPPPPVVVTRTEEIHRDVDPPLRSVKLAIGGGCNDPKTSVAIGAVCYNPPGAWIALTVEERDNYATAVLDRAAAEAVIATLREFFQVTPPARAIDGEWSMKRRSR